MYCRRAHPTSILFLLEPKKVPLEWWMFTLVSGLLLELRRLTMDHEGSSGTMESRFRVMEADNGAK
jgi:hypothetical protein